MPLNHRSKGLAVVASTAFFMQTLDVSILNTAIPAIAQSLQEPPLQMQLAIISYALTVALFIPLSGWAADKYGTLTIFRHSILMFVFGSVTCALSQNLTQLVLARILQGIGGSMMMPIARLTIIKTTPKNELIDAWNLMAMAGLIGPILGPVLGGWLVTYMTWHWIFLINIPIGILGILISGRYMPNVKGKATRLDLIGFLLFGCGLVFFSYGLERISKHIDNMLFPLQLILIGILLLVSYVFYSRIKRDPLLPLNLFRTKTYRLAIYANILVRLCGSGIPFLLPLMLQLILGYPPDKTGLLITPIAISSIMMKPVITRILKRFGYKIPLICITIGMSFSIFSLGLLKAHTPLWIYIIATMSYGCCMSMIFTAVNTLAISDLQSDNAGTGATLLSIIQQAGIGLSIAFSSVILHLYYAYFNQESELLSPAFSYTYFTVASIGVLLLICLSFLPSNAGHALHKR